MIWGDSMHDNNNGFDSMDDLDGFLGGYDSSSTGRNNGYNYGSTYSKKDQNTNDYYNSTNGNNSYYNDNNGYIDNGGNDYTNTNSGGYYNNNTNYNNYNGYINNNNSSQNGYGGFGAGQNSTQNYQGMPNGGYIPVKNNFDHSTYGGRTVSGGSGQIPQYQGAPVPVSNDFVSGNNNSSSFNNGYSSDVPQKTKLSVPSAAVRTLLPMIVILIPLCIFLASAINGAIHYDNIKKNGEAVTATVTNVTKSTKTTTTSKGRTKKTTTYTSYIQYLYKGKYYTGTLNENHTKGSSVTVYIDPDNPSDFISEKGSIGVQLGMWVLIVFVGFVSIVFITRFIQMITGHYTPPRRRRRARISIR